MGKRIVVIGGANLDLVGRSRVAYRSADSNPGSVKMSPGGVGRNIAENLSRLGAEVVFLSAIGQDPQGQLVARATEAVGVNLQHVLRTDCGTSTYLCILDEKGEMVGAINEMEPIEAVTAEVTRGWEAVIASADLCVIDANLSEAAIEAFFSIKGEVPVFVDPVSCAKAEKIKPYLAQVAGIKPNRLEAGVLTGLSSEDPIVLGQALLDMGVGEVVLSDGANGVYCFGDSQQLHCPVKPVKVVNVTGAGDAFMAAWVWSLFSWEDWMMRCRFAMAASALTIESEETIYPALSFEAVAKRKRELWEDE
jgi:pseudouridine kinase